MPWVIAVALLAFGCMGDLTTPTSDAVFTAVPQKVILTPGTAEVVVGGSTTMVAIVKDQRDSVMTGQPVVWSSTDFSIATVSTAGVVTGMAVGTVTISATAGTASATARVNVVPRAQRLLGLAR